jgi:hypothetical protein
MILDLHRACHPTCGTGMALMIDKEIEEAVPVRGQVSRI